MKTWIPMGFCVLLLLSVGCVCSPRGAGGNFNLGPVAYRQTACESCESESGPISNADFYSNAGPLASFFGLTNCTGGGCGELYVDEWLNEPPQVDQCGYSECLQCGPSPVRSLLRAIVGRQYTGSCESCDCGGSDIVGNGAIIHDGYEPDVWSSQRRGCACGTSESSDYITNSYQDSMNTDVVDPSRVQGSSSHNSSSSSQGSSDSSGQSILNDESPKTPSPPAGSSDSQGQTIVPTPAPSLPPSSASRLNPATRRVIR